MSCMRNPFNISVVIPGELAVASATRNPGISRTSGCRPSAKLLRTCFRRQDAEEANDLSNAL